MMELQRDLTGLDNLVQPGRQREKDSSPWGANMEYGALSIHESPAGGKWTGQPAQHSNTALHLCWHRNTSIGRQQHQQAFLASHPSSFKCHYLSGYLLRKFKNSSGWQKLWVVFTNFCLFFYKSFQVRFF
ncbi:unnamed protein product [Ixodes pacificus]